MLQKTFSRLKKHHAALLLAIAALLALALLQWPASAPPLPPAATHHVGITSIDWRGNTLRLGGHVPATATPQPVTLTIAETSQTATPDATGAFQLQARLAQKTPTRASLTIGDATYDLLFVRVQGRWLALQRADQNSSGGKPNNERRGWQTVAGAAENSGGIHAITKDTAGYVLALQAPTADLFYIYADGQLAQSGTIAATTNVMAALPATTAEARADFYQNAAPTLRLRQNLPPANAAARFDLNDGTLWLFTDFAIQKAALDESFAGQFFPLGSDAPLVDAPRSDSSTAAAATAAVPADKAAPAPQKPPTD